MGGGLQNSDPWLVEFTRVMKREFGIYDAIAIERWRYLADMAVRLAPRGITLKTDAWNEAIGSNTSILISRDADTPIDIIDISPGILAYIKGNLKRVCADIRLLPYRGQSISCILDISTSDHCPPNEIEDILVGYHRVLVPNGILLLIHNSNNCIPWKIARWFGYHSPAYSGFPPAYYFDCLEFERNLQNAGFTILENWRTNYWGTFRKIINPISLFNPGAIRMLALLEIKFHFPFSKYYGRQNVILAKKLPTTAFLSSDPDNIGHLQ